MDTFKFVPENLQDQELFKKFTTLLDKVLEKEAELLKPVLAKLDPESGNLEYALKEFGFDYLAEILNTENLAPDLLAYFSMIRAFKGKRSGLELIFRLLGWGYEIKEWWEEGGSGIPYTADIVLDVDAETVNLNLDDLHERIAKFIRSYVYPLVTVAISWGVLAQVSTGLGDVVESWSESFNIQSYQFSSAGTGYYAQGTTAESYAVAIATG